MKLNNITRGLLIILLLCIFIEFLTVTMPVNAYSIGNNIDINLNVNNITEKSISWAWNNSVYESCNITKDDIPIIENYVNNQILFTGLRSNEIHKISLICNNTIYQDLQTTHKSSYDSINSFLNDYKYFLLALGLLILSLIIRSPIFGLAGLAIMFLGFIYNIAPLVNGSSSPTLDILIYGIGLILAVIIGFAGWR